jgi:hypothetical protein
MEPEQSPQAGQNRLGTPLHRLRLAARLAAAILAHNEVPANLIPRAEQEIPPINADEVLEARSFFPMEKFFIFGHARSGTTLLTRLIRVHPAVHCNYQGHFFTRAPLLQGLVADPEVRAWLTRRSNRWNRGQDLSPVVLRAVCDYIMERDASTVGKTIVGDKSPNSLLDGEAVRLMSKVYPDGRLIFIVRDGRDAAISHRFQAFIDNPKSLSREDLQIRQEFVRTPEPFLSGQKSIFTEKGLIRAAQGWVKNVTETDQRAHQLYPHQYLSLRYEDLLRSHREEMSRIWTFLGADLETPSLFQALEAELQQNPDADWQLQKAGEIAIALQKGKSGSWQNLMTTRDQHLFWEVAGTTLLAWGY